MSVESIKLLCDLSNLPGCPSGEHAVHNYLKERYAKIADEVLYDNLGGIFAVKYSEDKNAPKLMLAGHLDEVGFMVIRIQENGMLEIRKLGGVWESAILCQRVYVHTKKEKIVGMISPINSQPLPGKPVTINEVVVDIGASNKNEVESWGIYPGQLVTFATEAETMKNERMIIGKAWDDRVGCAMALETMSGLKEDKLACHLYTGGTVQEEGGRRGALIAANLVKPDLFLALEGPLAHDISGKKDAFGRIGQGVLFRVIDRELKLSQELRDYFLDIAKTYNIPYQFYVSAGGTDAGLIQTTGLGVNSAVIAIPARCRHSAQSIIHLDDYQAAVEFLKQFAKSFNRTVYQSLLMCKNNNV